MPPERRTDLPTEACPEPVRAKPGMDVFVFMPALALSETVGRLMPSRTTEQAIMRNVTSGR